MKIDLIKSQNISIAKLETNKGQIDGLPKNPRLIKDAKFEKLKKSIEDNPEMLGMREVLVYPHGSKFVIIGGNMRFQACKELQFETLPCKILSKDTTAEQLRAITIKDNVGFGEHDWELLANEWDSVELEEWGLEVPNFETEDTILEAEEDDYEEPDNLKVDVVLGDLIEFECTDGRVHRLICGDSTDSDTVERLMNGEKAEMVFTDPPYGMFLDTDYSQIKKTENSIGFKGNQKGNKYDKIIGDNEDFTPELINTIFANFNYCKEIFIWGADYFIDLIPNFGKDGSWFVWNKRSSEAQQRGIGNTFDLCWSKSKHKRLVFDFEWFGFLSKDDPKEARNRVHPSMKPSKLLSKLITEYCKGNILVDLFLGSGSTLVAAHQLKRKCYGIELSEKYCQVIIDRMQKLDSTIKVKINSKDYNYKIENIK
jgi:DNA modification methylase